MNATDQTIDVKSSADNNVGISAGILVFIIGLYPVCLAGLITLGIFLSGAVEMDDGIGHESAYASFIFPAPGVNVSETFTASGNVHELPLGEVAYLVERAHNKYWPKMRIGSTPGEFARDQSVTEGAGYKYSLEILIMNSAAAERTDNWFRQGEETGMYPGLTDMTGAQVVAKVRVVR